ncbi:MAG: hypothetical protein GX811_04195, partial [Lentisphaerae bacterium]|nr:hypothetical protein [Lentisphaerota bacterium]
GFLITTKTDSAGEFTPLNAKISVQGLSVDGGLSRWLRFSDSSKIELLHNGIPVEISEGTDEFKIEIHPTVIAEYEISMHNQEDWAADTNVTVEYFVKDRKGRTFPGADKVRLLRPVVIAIGDSLTFGYMADSNRQPLTMNWSQLWDNYPKKTSWNSVDSAARETLNLAVPALETDITNQGWRGYLRAQLPGFLWLGEGANNDNIGHGGHGPPHCGYSGAKIGHITARMMPNHVQYRVMPAKALKTYPCYAVVICFIGINDCNDPKENGKSIFEKWMECANKIMANREGGKTLFVSVTLPNEETPWASYQTNNFDRIQPLNNMIMNYQFSFPFARSSVANCSNIQHDVNDDGLHFLPPTYEQISTVLFESIKSGLAIGVRGSQDD